MCSNCTQHFNGFKCSGISAKPPKLLILLHCYCLICTSYSKLYLIVEWFGNCSEITWCSFCIRCDSGAVKEQTRFPCGGRAAMKCNDEMILEVSLDAASCARGDIGKPLLEYSLEDAGPKQNAERYTADEEQPDLSDMSLGQIWATKHPDSLLAALPLFGISRSETRSFQYLH